MVAFSWNCWNSTPSIQQYMSENDVSLVDLYATFERKVQSYANANNRDVILWDEVFTNVRPFLHCTSSKGPNFPPKQPPCFLLGSLHL